MKFQKTAAAAVLAASATCSAGSASAQAANDCVSVRHTSDTAFFKSRMHNMCSRTIVVHYCEAQKCAGNANYYNASDTLEPGESVAVDTEGQGIHWAACIHEAPDWDTPNSDSSGRFHCD